MTTAVTTNHHPRDLLSGHDLPAGVLQSEFDYAELKEDSDEIHSARFFQYRESWYDVHQFSRIGEHTVEPHLAYWDGAQTDSAWSGVLFRYARDEFGEMDGDAVIVGSAYWG